MRRESESIETLQSSLGRLVAERQELRRHGANPAELERNRQAIVSRQRELGLALIARYSHAPAA